MNETQNNSQVIQIGTAIPIEGDHFHSFRLRFNTSYLSEDIDTALQLCDSIDHADITNAQKLELVRGYLS